MSLFDFKKGQIHNYLLVPIILIGMAIEIIFMTKFLQEFIIQFQGTGLYTGVIETVGNQFLAVMQLYDIVFVFFMTALIIGVGLTSYRLNTSPAFFIVTLIGASLMGLVSYFFNFIFSQIVSQPVLIGTAALFPRTLLFCTNFHWIALISLVIGSIALYGKKEVGAFVQE